MLVALLSVLIIIVISAGWLIIQRLNNVEKLMVTIQDRLNADPSELDIIKLDPDEIDSEETDSLKEEEGEEKVSYEELVSMIKNLSHLEHFPLADEGRDISYEKQLVCKSCMEARDYWKYLHREEHMNFIKTDATFDTYKASNQLKQSLKTWSVECYKSRLIDSWSSLYSQTLIDVMSGKITIEDAKELIIDSKPDIENIDRNLPEVNYTYDVFVESMDDDSTQNILKQLRKSFKEGET